MSKDTHLLEKTMNQMKIVLAVTETNLHINS